MDSTCVIRKPRTAKAVCVSFSSRTASSGKEGPSPLTSPPIWSCLGASSSPSSWLSSSSSREEGGEEEGGEEEEGEEEEAGRGESTLPAFSESPDLPSLSPLVVSSSSSSSSPSSSSVEDRKRAVVKDEDEEEENGSSVLDGRKGSLSSRKLKEAVEGKGSGSLSSVECPLLVTIGECPLPSTTVPSLPEEEEPPPSPSEGVNSCCWRL